MAVSVAEIIILGLLADWCLRRMRLPGLLGMLFVGFALGPYVFRLLARAAGVGLCLAGTPLFVFCGHPRLVSNPYLDTLDRVRIQLS